MYGVPTNFFLILLNTTTRVIFLITPQKDRETRGKERMKNLKIICFEVE